MTPRSRAKDLILRWFDEGKPDAALRRRFKADIDRFFDTNRTRNDWRECITTTLEDEDKVRFRMSGPNWSAYPTGQGIAVTSVVPGWARGWRGVFKDEVSEHQLSWLGHYARQYIHRSTVAKVLMAAWEREQLVLHPFGASSLMQRYTVAGSIPSAQAMIANARKELVADPSSPSASAPVIRSAWGRRNTLDPALHQAISHFLRGQSLLKAGFELEALVAFDCVLQSLQFMGWSCPGRNPRQDRGDLCRALGLGQPSIDVAEQTYFLRNHFLAHAGGWRWWDAGEYLEDDLAERAATLAWRALRKAADMEPQVRRIDPSPDDWSTWLEAHFELIWEAVWYKLA